MNSRWCAPCSLASALLVSLLTGGALAAPPTAPLPTIYAVTSTPTEPLALSAPKLPDLSGYTASAVMAKIRDTPRGQVAVKRMLQQDVLKQFVGGNNRLAEWVRRQGGMPQAIFIEGGYVDLATLARKLPGNYFGATAEGTYLARLPIVVAH